MKIVFSVEGENCSWDALIDPRLGRAQNFVIYDEASGSLERLSNALNSDKEHGAGLHMAKLMLDLGADVIITGNGPGEKASAVLAKSDIEIYVGATGMSLKSAYDAYQNSELKKF